MKPAERVVVVGAAGFVGRALTRSLLASGIGVDAVVRSSTARAEPGATAHVGGLEDTATMQRLVDGCTTIVHVASASTPSVSRSSPTIESDLNLSPTLRLLEVLQGHPGKHLVYMSSGGAVYGSTEGTPVRETAPLAPQSYYGAGKVAIEAFLGAFAHAHGTRVTILRPSNVYGPGQPRYLAFGVVRTMLQHALDGTTVEIWGDGSVVRDYLYIDDLVDAFMRVIAAGAPGATYNVGAGAGHSLREVLDLVEQVSGRNVAREFRSARTIDVPRIVLDCAAIRRDMGWIPATPLRAGLERTWEWLAGSAPARHNPPARS
jgi:UDP-glucose 4-epimerase